MNVIWTDPAQTDLYGILEYIARNNPDAADRSEIRIVAAVDGLTEHPRRGRPGRVAGTRELVVPGLPYVVVYTIAQPEATADPEVAILRVVHGAIRSA
jgi:toxin ParE1/3/4